MLGQIGKHSDQKTEKAEKVESHQEHWQQGNLRPFFFTLFCIVVSILAMLTTWSLVRGRCEPKMFVSFNWSSASILNCCCRYQFGQAFVLWVFCRYPHSPGSHQSSQCKSSLIVSNITSREICHNLNSYSRLEAGDWKKTFSFMYRKLK